MSGEDICRAIFVNISRTVNVHEWVGENICDISAACDFTPCKWEFAPSVGMVETKCSVIDFRNLLLVGKCFTFKTQNFTRNELEDMRFAHIATIRFPFSAA